MAAIPTKTHKLIAASDRPELVEEIESLAEEMAIHAGLSDEERDSLAIAVTEIANNAIIHGNKRNPKKKVFVTLTAREGEVHIVIRDQGKGFNPDGLRNPLDPENLLRESGRGIFIVRSLMDAVDFDFSRGGTEISVVKRKKK